MSIKKNTINLSNYLKNFFTKGHQRSLEAKKNIIAALLIKGISIIISLVLVPLTIGYINPSQYGIWLTLSSMIAWISFFDVGFTHGLRNKFAEAKARGEDNVVRTYVSTTYFYIGIIFICLWIFLLLGNLFISWHQLLNLPSMMEEEISKIAMLIFTYFCFQFIFRIINTILIADQQSAKASLIDMLGQLFGLIIIFILTKFTKGSLLNLGFSVGIAPTLVLLLANIILFKKKYKKYTPSLKFVKKNVAGEIMQLGLKFFVVQIASIIQFETSLFLIAHYFENKVLITSYNIAFKYFFTLQMVFMILLSPLWSGVTDAYTSGDLQWVKNAVRKYLFLLMPFIIGGIIMLLLSEQVYRLWLGKNLVNIDFSISLLCLVYFITSMFASIFVFVINGVGAIRIQFISSIFTSIAFFLIALLLIKHFNFGVQAVLISSIITNVFGYIIAPVQYYQIFYKKSAAKIWYK